MLQSSLSTIKSEIKSNLSVSIPLIVTNTIFSFSNFLGTAMVAKLGQDALAASVLVSMMWASLSVLFMGILNAICVLVSHQYGAKNEKVISQIMGQAYLLGLVVCLLVVGALYSMEFFLEWSGQPRAVLLLSYDYLHSLMWTVPALVVWVVTEQFLMGIGYTKLVLRISFLVVPVEIPLIYALIFGKWGFPQCGIAGIGYGFAVSYTLSAIGLVIYMIHAKKYKSFRIFSAINEIHMPYLKELIRIGFPLGLMQVIEVSAFAITTFWIARFGTIYLAAHQIVMQYLGFAITAVFAMSQAVTIRVGHAVGRQDIVGIKYAIYVGILLNFCLVSIIAYAFYAVPNLLLSLDIDVQNGLNADLISNAVELFAIAGLLLLFDNIRIVGFGALRGLKDAHFSMLTSLIAFWFIGLSAAFILGFYFGLEGSGIWWGLTLGIASGAFIVLGRLRYFLADLDNEKLVKMGQV